MCMTKYIAHNLEDAGKAKWQQKEIRKIQANTSWPSLHPCTFKLSCTQLGTAHLHQPQVIHLIPTRKATKLNSWKVCCCIEKPTSTGQIQRVVESRSYDSAAGDSGQWSWTDEDCIGICEVCPNPMAEKENNQRFSLCLGACKFYERFTNLKRNLCWRKITYKHSCPILEGRSVQSTISTAAHTTN